MDAGHDRSKWRRICVPCVLIMLLIPSTQAVLRLTGAEYENTPGRNTSQSETCADHEYLSTKGFCCDRCPPGYKLKSECAGEGLRSDCGKCRKGTYLDVTNHVPNCNSCLKCKTDEDVISNCTHEKNTVCKCKPGYYKHVINSITWMCKTCKKCGNGERVRRECDGEKNTECECERFYYRVRKNQCIQCTNCTEECQHHCLSTPKTPRETFNPKQESTAIEVILLAVTLAVFVIVVLLTVGIKHWRKKKRAPLSIESPDCQKSEIRQPPLTTPVNENGAVTSRCMDYEQDQLLPDCVPREIRTHEFIYFVLEMVPINRFKELMRRLNVSEQDIDRAERDNRAFADAQYQMLKIWSNNAPGGGKNILPRRLLQEFVDILKDMNLNGCAESIENKFCTEA